MSAAALDLSIETAAEYLRLTLPLMSRHKVPAIPQNYAVWYSYASGDIPELKAEIDQRIAAKAEFSADVNARLYQKYIADHDIDGVERIRGDLNQILREVGSSLHDAGNNATSFGGTLGSVATEVARQDDLRDIRKLLETLIDETRTMQTVTTGMQSQFASKAKEIEELQNQLQHERQRANTDPLTGLYNRFALLDRLSEAVSEMAEGAPPSLVMLDIDRFKKINDTHGHLIGDRVIRFVAQVMGKNIKGKDTAARYGGEEFTVLLPETTSQGAKSVAESIRQIVSQAQLVRADNKKPLGQITVSAGVATYRPGEDVMEFINRADRALYRSKNAGRDRVTVD